MDVPQGYKNLKNSIWKSFIILLTHLNLEKKTYNLHHIIDAFQLEKKLYIIPNYIDASQFEKLYNLHYFIDASQLQSNKFAKCILHFTFHMHI